MQNLRDKLLKAGLVTQEQAQAVETESRRPKPERANEAPRRRESRDHREGGREPRRNEPREAKEARVPKLPPLPGSKAHQRMEAQKQRELDQKLLELVRTSEVPVEPGDRPFYFVTRKGRLRRLELSEAQARLLEEGKLAVVERQEPAQIEHSLVPPEVAEQMHALFPKSVRFLNRPDAAIGFLSDEQLKVHQAEEAAAVEREKAAETPAEGTPTEEPPPGETWVAIKRSPR